MNSIDDMRVDGKFMVGNDIPDGQGSVIELLEECFEMLYDLRMDAVGEEEQEQEEQITQERSGEEIPQVGVAA